MTEKIIVNGYELPNRAMVVQEVSGLWQGSAIRVDDYEVPGRHGVIVNPKRMYSRGKVVIPLFVTGVDPVTGATNPSTSVAQLRTNVRTLTALFSAPSLLVVHVYPDNSQVECLAKLANAPMEFERTTSYPESAKIVFSLDIPGSFWVDSSIQTQTLSASSGETEISWTTFTGADAPMDELEVTFTGPISNPMIRQGNCWLRYNDVIADGNRITFFPDGRYLGFTGDDYETAYDLDYSKVEHFGCGRWFELQPGVPPKTLFTHTGGNTASVTLTGRRKYLIG